MQVDPAAVKSFAAAMVGAPAPATPPAAPVTVDVSNAGPQAGLAARVRGFLGDHGFTKGTTGNTGTRRTSLVRFGADLAQRGAEVAKLLGGLTTQESAAVPAGHIEVVLGTVYAGPARPAAGAPRPPATSRSPRAASSA